MKKLLPLLLLLIMQASLKAEEYHLRFQTDPKETQWRVVKAGARPDSDSPAYTQNSIDFKFEECLADDPHEPRKIRIQFHCKGYEDAFVDVDFNTLLKSNDDGSKLYLEHDAANNVVWKDKIALIPSSFTAWAQKVPALVIGLLVCLGGALAMAQKARKKQKLAAQLQQRRQLEEELSRQAIGSDDPIVKNKKRFGRYQVFRKLGQGGMAAVYWGLPADTLEEQDAVAIKVMKPELTSEDDRHRFKREIKVIRELHHPHIVRLEDADETEHGELYMAMELVDGGPISIPPKGLPLAQVTTYLKPILEALSYAHGRGVVHRDIKPANMMVTSGGSVKVMDFGLARSHDTTRVTKTGTMLGSPAYVPPEQLLDGALTPLADQYSLGATLYEMLTGHVPFERKDTMATLMAHMTEAPPPLNEWRPDLPPSIERVVLRMLEKTPQNRFPDLNAVGQAWQEALANPQAFADWQPAQGSRPSALPEKPLPIPNLPLDGGQDTLC